MHKPRKPNLTLDECTNMIERERLSATLAMREGFINEAFECLRFVDRMMQYRDNIRYYEKRFGSI